MPRKLEGLCFRLYCTTNFNSGSLLLGEAEKWMHVVFSHQDVRDQVLSSCKHLSSYKFRGIAQIRISPDLTRNELKIQSTAFQVKRCVELASTDYPWLLGNGRKLSHVGIAFLARYKEKAEHFDRWIAKLQDLADKRTDGCMYAVDTREFKQAWDKLQQMRKQLSRLVENNGAWFGRTRRND